VRTLWWTDRAAPSKPKRSFSPKKASDVRAARLGPRVRRERPSGRLESSWFEHPLRGTACTRRVVPRTVCAQGGVADFFAEQGGRCAQSWRMLAPGKVRDYCPPLCFHNPPHFALGPPGGASVRAMCELNTAMFILIPGLDWRGARGGLERGGCPGCGSGCARRGAAACTLTVASPRTLLPRTINSCPRC
jgi:hypothetical protein